MDSNFEAKRQPLIETLATGDEVISGDVLDTNGSGFARILTERGIYLSRQTTLSDDFASLQKGITEISERADMCVVSGGLGPTLDDLTTDVVCKIAGVATIEDQEAVSRMKQIAEKYKMPFAVNNLRSARIPEGATVYQTEVGTAPAYSRKIGRCLFFFLPGPPREFNYFLKTAVLPWVDEHFPLPFEKTLQLKLLGLPESQVAHRLSDIEHKWPEVRFGYRAHSPEVWVKATARAASDHSFAVLKEVKAEILARVGEHVFAEGNDELVVVLHELLLKHKVTLSLAESCTGGLMAQSLTALSGASQYFKGGLVSYSNDVKSEFLGVNASVLSEKGAVSHECAAQMVTGAQRRFSSDYSIAVTGIAGPTGGTELKPVGLVFLALADQSDGSVQVLKRNFRGDRSRIQKAAAMTGFEMLRRKILGLSALADGWA